MRMSEVRFTMVIVPKRFRNVLYARSRRWTCDPQAILGLVLVLGGITLVVLQLAGVFVDRAAVDVGGLELGVERSARSRGCPGWPAAVVLVGALLMVTARR
jgi:hypothetical protein